MDLKKLKLKIDETNDLNDLLQSRTFNNIMIVCNGIRVPVPHHLLEKWCKDLENHRETLKKELINALRE